MFKVIARLAVLSLLASNLMGCAQLVTKQYGSQKGGTVKYTKELFMTDKNRKKALEVANDYCRPSRAVLVSEEDKVEFNGQSSTQTQHYGKYSSSTTSQSQSATVYINFRCGGRSKTVASTR